MFRLTKDIWEHRELVALLIQRNLKVRYKGSALGFLWSLLTPLCHILMYAVFAGILKFNDGQPGYLPFLVVGIVCWQFTATCLGDSLNAITGHVNLVKKVAFPRIVLPLATVLANAVNFLLTCLVLAAYLALQWPSFGPLWWLPALVVAQTALCLGVSLIACTCNVFFRDTEHIVAIGSMAWFFMTPVFYPLSFVTDRLRVLDGALQSLAFLNPMTGIVSAYRCIWMGSPSPGWAGMAISGAIVVGVLLTGVAAFQRNEHRFADEL